MTNEAILRRALSSLVERVDDYFAQFSADGELAPYREEARDLGQAVKRAIKALEKTR